MEFCLDQKYTIQEFLDHLVLIRAIGCFKSGQFLLGLLVYIGLIGLGDPFMLQGGLFRN